MNKQIRNALINKYVYVDIDGTLSEYRFNNHVSANDGTTNGQTMEEIRNHVFLNSRPLKSVIRTLGKVKSKRNYICGAVISPVEVIDKFEWLKKNCKELEFSNYYWFVPEEYWSDFLVFFEKKLNREKFILTDDFVMTRYGTFLKGCKTRMWDWLAEHNMHEMEDIVFVDDVLSYLKYAEEKGVTAYHISSFID